MVRWRMWKTTKTRINTPPQRMNLEASVNERFSWVLYFVERASQLVLDVCQARITWMMNATPTKMRKAQR